MDIKVGDKVFFELDDMSEVMDLTPGKEYGVHRTIPRADRVLAGIVDDVGFERITNIGQPSAQLKGRASWQKVQ